MSKISIIVPFFNAEKHLEKCLQSLIAQTHSHIEVIGVDDGSTDKSLDIFKACTTNDPRFKVIQQKNAGAGAARNNALNIVTGDYLLFCDSDDWYEPNLCEQMLQTMLTKKVDLVTCGLKPFKDDQSYERPSTTSEELFGYHRLIATNKRKIRGALCNKLFKIELINRYNIRFPALNNYEDEGFVATYIGIAQSVYGLDAALYNRLLHADSIMHAAYFNQKNLHNRIAVTQSIRDNFIKMGVFEANFEYWLSNCWNGLSWVFQCCQDENQREELLHLLNQKVLYDTDLDREVAESERTILKMLQEIKNKNFSTILSLYRKPLPKKRSLPIKMILAGIKAYLLFPYYIYKIYKIIQKNHK